MIVELPLFQNAELTRLQERRNALLKRVQAMPSYTTGRPVAIFKLQQVTAEIMRLENDLRRKHH